MALTDTACKAAACPAGRPYQRFADSGGMYLEVTRTGAKCWRWKYRFAGKEKRLALGLYPAVGLASARRARDEARQVLTDGSDPGEVRKRSKLAAQHSAASSFKTIALEWWGSWKNDKSDRHARYVKSRLEADAFPLIGHKSVGELLAPDFVRMAKAIERRGAADLPRRVLETCGQVMRYAVAHGFADRNPVADVKPSDVLKPHRTKNHARVSAADLPELMRKIHVYDGSPYTRMALELMAHTFVRTSELIQARWGEFDLDAAEWRIPPERMKMGRLHIVPLSHQALYVLGYLRSIRGEEACTPGALLFPGERDHAKPMSNNTILYALYRMGYRGRMTGHGFRGVASTILNEMGYRPDVIEMQLAHVERNKVRGAYNHALYLDERCELVQAWSNYLQASRETGKVVPFRRDRAAA